MFTTVVVPVDQTAESLRALRPAQAIARAIGADLVAVSVVSDRATEQSLTAELLEKVKDCGVRVSQVVVRSDSNGIGDWLCRASRTCQHALIVASAPVRPYPVGDALTVADHLIQKWPSIPLLFVGPQVGADWIDVSGPIVACIDSAARSDAVVVPVVLMARALRMSPWIMSVIAPATTARGALPLPTGALAAEIQSVQAIANKVRRLGVAEVNWDVLHGHDPAGSIVGYAGALNASIVAIATSQRSEHSRLSLGGVAVETVLRSSCPVLAVHARA